MAREVTLGWSGGSSPVLRQFSDIAERVVSDRTRAETARLVAEPAAQRATEAEEATSQDRQTVETARDQILPAVEQATTASALAIEAREAVDLRTAEINQISLQVAADEESASTSAGVAVQARNETEAFAAGAGTAANFYDTIALGRAAVADGEQFGVRAGQADGLVNATVYRRTSPTTQVVVIELVGPSALTAVETRLAALETVTIDELGHASGVREAGTSIAPTITWSLSRTDIVASATINGVAVDPDAGSYTAPSVSTTTSYTMVITDQIGRTVQRSTSVVFRSPLFVGRSPLATLADGDLAALDKTLPASPNLERNVVAQDGDYIWIVWDLVALGPQSGFKMAGLNVTPVITDRVATTPAGHTSTYRFMRSPVAVSAGSVPVEVIQ